MSLLRMIVEGTAPFDASRELLPKHRAAKQHFVIFPDFIR